MALPPNDSDLFPWVSLSIGGDVVGWSTRIDKLIQLPESDAMKCNPCRDCGDCWPPRLNRGIMPCLEAVKDCQDRAGEVDADGPVPKHPDRAWLERKGHSSATVEDCIRGYLLQEEAVGIVLTVRGLFWLKGK